jgi:hypothetical protein
LEVHLAGYAIWVFGVMLILVYCLTHQLVVQRLRPLMIQEHHLDVLGMSLLVEIVDERESAVRLLATHFFHVVMQVKLLYELRFFTECFSGRSTESES